MFSSNDNEKKSFKKLCLRNDSALYVAEQNVKVYSSNESLIYSEPPF